MWPRDATFAAIALDRCGYEETTKKFFSFCSEVLTEYGYLLHKYNSDKSLGSSWHPWSIGEENRLPIQEDETALVLHALLNHYSCHKDIDFVEEMYEMVEKAAEFLYSYRNAETKLPLASYDLWEEKFCVSTFTSSAVCAGLFASSKLSALLGKKGNEKKYLNAAKEIKEAIAKLLYDPETKLFLKCMENGKKDKRADISSVYSIYGFDILPLEDTRLQEAIKRTEEKLFCRTIGGYARFEDDKYFRIKEDKNITGNPWFVTTLWLSQYYAKKAKTKEELKKAYQLIEWASKNATETGMLAEQLNPYNSRPLSVTPLIWSHSAFVLAFLDYMEKFNSLT